MIYLILILLLTSCHSEQRISKRALKDMAKAEQRYNLRSDIDTVGAHYCNTMHPVKIGKGTVIYKEGKPRIDTVKGDPIYIDCDTVNNKGVVKVPCPPSIIKRIVDTFDRVDTFTNDRKEKLQAAEIVGLKAALVKSDEDKAKMATRLQIERERANKRLWWIIALIAMIVAYFIIKSPKLKVFEWRK